MLPLEVYIGPSPYQALRKLTFSLPKPRKIPTSSEMLAQAKRLHRTVLVSTPVQTRSLKLIFNRLTTLRLRSCTPIVAVTRLITAQSHPDSTRKAQLDCMLRSVWNKVSKARKRRLRRLWPLSKTVRCQSLMSIRWVWFKTRVRLTQKLILRSSSASLRCDASPDQVPVVTKSLALLCQRQRSVICRTLGRLTLASRITYTRSRSKSPT